MQRRRFRLYRASRADAAWLREVLARESTLAGGRIELPADATLRLHRQRGGTDG